VRPAGQSAAHPFLFPGLSERFFALPDVGSAFGSPSSMPSPGGARVVSPQRQYMFDDQYTEHSTQDTETAIRSGVVRATGVCRLCVMCACSLGNHRNMLIGMACTLS